jgi:hypothetical protein
MDKFISARDLAVILDLSERRVNQIAKEGVIFSRNINGKFDVVSCVESFYKAKFNPEENKLSYDAEHTLHEKAKREKAELELAKMKNELHRASDIEYVLSNMLAVFRNRILGIAPAMAPVLTGIKNTNKIKDLLDVKLREALTELSEYDPAMFGAGEGFEDESEADVEFIPKGSSGGGPSAGADSQSVG